VPVLVEVALLQRPCSHQGALCGLCG
jgi:hypothetical protein